MSWRPLPHTGAGAQAHEQKPNIAAIMTDVGWGDLGSCGGGVMPGARRLTPVLFDQTLHDDLTTKPNRQASY